MRTAQCISRSISNFRYLAICLGPSSNVISPAFPELMLRICSTCLSKTTPLRHGFRKILLRAKKSQKSRQARCMFHCHARSLCSMREQSMSCISNEHQSTGRACIGSHRTNLAQGPGSVLPILNGGGQSVHLFTLIRKIVSCSLNASRVVPGSDRGYQ